MDSVEQLLEQGEWVEVRLHPTYFPFEVYADLPPVLFVHHFYDEPWWPDRYVIRLLLVKEDAAAIRSHVARLPAVASVGSWTNVHQDQELYRDHFYHAMTFFQGASRMANWPRSPKEREWIAGKLVHCYLNAAGIRNEPLWALRYAWRRILLSIKLKLGMVDMPRGVTASGKPQKII